ncbi:MAG TPA: energy-dependent translational throttle protein EttA [Bdellovibrionota bacterium]|nr:energy-dependent translational throttle protein EttA [Bdellovibrionota bacterium]
MPQIIYTLKGLSKIHPPSKQVLKDIYLSFYDDAKIGIIGVNGSGKSTLLKIMAGIDTDFAGEAFIGEGKTVGYLAQEPELDPTKNVKENVMEGLKEIANLLKEFEDISMKFGEEMTDVQMEKLLTRQAEVQERIEAAGAWELDRKIEVAMDALRCPPADAEVTNLSGGEKRRVALCRLLLSAPDLLLLDEPTNHLDAESVAWLEKHLQEYKGSVVLITHDRYFLDNVVGWILELDRGQGIPWEGNYSSWLEQKQKRLEHENKQETKRQKELARELEWIRKSPKARQSKSKARVSSYETLLNQDVGEKIQQLEIYIPAGPRLGDSVIEANGVSKAFGDKLLFENLNFRLPKGGIVGIIGPNGAGKTTLFKLITGQEKADAGTFKVGETVKLAYVDQSRGALAGDKSIFEEITGGTDNVLLGTREVPARGYVSKFGFSGNDQQKKVGVLSGGERNRVHLAKMLKEGGNVILLDEPTNDLDVGTLRALEEGLESFGGCAVIISHDRWFLDRIATHILAFEGDSHVEWFEGNYQEYEADKRRRLGSSADEIKRIRYKTLTR